MAVGKQGAGVGHLGAVLGTASTQPWYYTDAAYDLDFQNGRYNGAALTSVLSVTRSGATATDLLYTDAPSASYNTYAANTLRVKSGQGLLIEDTAVNLLASPTAPATQTVTISSTGAYWLWVNGSGNATVAAGTATISAGGTASHGVPLTFNVTATGTITVTVTGSLYVFQLERGASVGQACSPTSFVNGTRNFETVNFIGGAATLLLATTGTAIVYQSAAFIRTGVSLLNDSVGTIQLGLLGNTTDLRSQNGTNSFNATLGFGGTLAAPFKAGLKWNASNRSMSGNGGTTVQNTGTATFSGTPRLGASTRPNYPVRRVTLWSSELSNAVFEARTTVPGADQRIAGWGDSLVVLFNQLGATFSPSRTVVSTGYAGQNSTYIAAQMVADSTRNGYTVCWLTGRNDGTSWDIPTIRAADDSMVAHVTSGKYLIGTITNSPREPSGSAGYTNLTAANADRISRFPSNYVDTRAAIVAAYDPANPADVVDHANDVPPYSLRADIAAGTLTQNISASDTSFTISDGTLGNGNVIKIGSEYILILSTSGTTVTNCTRGYAGTAASHNNGDAYTGKDVVHFNTAGYAVLAQAFHDAIAAKGW